MNTSRHARTVGALGLLEKPGFERALLLERGKLIVIVLLCRWLIKNK
jgi:hypothetical protein